MSSEACAKTRKTTRLTSEGFLGHGPHLPEARGLASRPENDHKHLENKPKVAKRFQKGLKNRPKAGPSLLQYKPRSLRVHIEHHEAGVGLDFMHRGHFQPKLPRLRNIT